MSQSTLQNSATTAGPLAGRRVLLLTGSDPLRQVEEKLLRECGAADVVAVGLLSEALTAYASCDVVMADVASGGMMLLQKIRGDAATAGKPVVLTNSQASPETIVQAMQAGVSNYIVRPYNAQGLAQKMAAALVKHPA